MLGSWELFVTHDGQDPSAGVARHPITLTLKTDRGILAGNASIPVVLASDEGPKFKDPVVKPLAAPRYDGRTFSFMVDNGEEYLIGEVTRTGGAVTPEGDVFEGRWTASLSA